MSDLLHPARRVPASDADTLDVHPASPTARRSLVLTMAFITTVIEALSVAGLVPDVRVGTLELSLGLVPALGLAAVCGERLLGRSTRRSVAVGYWICIAVLLPALGIVYWRGDRLGLWFSLVTAALGEELIYRLAVPAVAAVVLRAVGLDHRQARIGGLIVGGVWFVLLPGHLEQMHSPLASIPFIAYASLAALLVYRSGSVLPMAAGHAVINLLTVLVWSESVAKDARGMGLACVLGLLVLAYGRPRRMTITDDGRMVDTVTGLSVATIDLRDGRPATVTLTDGTEIEVHPGSVVPAGTPRREAAAVGPDVSAA